jgi:hypothetical protein
MKICPTKRADDHCACPQRNRGKKKAKPWGPSLLAYKVAYGFNKSVQLYTPQQTTKTKLVVVVVGWVGKSHGHWLRDDGHAMCCLPFPPVMQ